jgi:hypothetical protein
MLFQTLDDKKECVGIYHNKILDFHNIPEDLTQTWSYSPYLKDKNIEYAQLYVEGKTLEEVVPEHLKEKWTNINSKMKAFVASFLEAKVSLKENCFFDLVPKKFLIDYCEAKNDITKFVLENNKKPIEYDFFRRFNEILVDISFRELNIDLDCMKDDIGKDKDLNFYRKLVTYNKKISYNLFGAITGRISTNKNSFPIHNFPKTYRKVIKPHNDWFVAFDVNAAELRTALALLEKDQPKDDLYQEIADSIYEGKFTRTQVKEMTTAWLYNSSNQIAAEHLEKLDNLFEKQNLLYGHWDGKKIYTPFNREIESDEFHAISYLNQSTFIDLFHRQAIKVDDFLKGSKSFISFFLHDEFVIDMTDDEKQNILDIVRILQDTEFGKFLVNVKVGKDFGNMKKLKLKV